MAKIKTSFNALRLALSVFDFLKAAMLAFSVAAVEYFRSKAHSADDKTAVAETSLKILKGKIEIDKIHDQKSDIDIINEYLDNDE